MAAEFTGFPREGLDFLAELPDHDKEWFAQNRKPYEVSVMAPAKAFVGALGERLQEDISPAIVSQPKVNGSISPINRDVRFSADNSRTRITSSSGGGRVENKKLSPTLFVRVSPESIGFAAGSMFESLERWRELVDDDVTGTALVDAIDRLATGRDLDVAGTELKRVPAPYAPDHPRGDLLRHKHLQVRWPEPLPANVTKPGFVEWCAERLIALGDVHRWLVENL